MSLLTSSYSGNNALVPVRVDVTSDDKSVRIVDTVLMDPNCWFIPLYSPLHEAVERNVILMAQMIIGESEVQGMGRTVRHFTGRVDLWTKSIQIKIQDQIRPQLLQILCMSSLPTTTLSSIPSIISNDSNNSNNDNKNATSDSNKPDKLIKIHLRMSVHGISIHEDFTWDPSMPFVTPLEYSKNIAQELNLPDEAVVAIVTTIMEQIYGVPIDTSTDTSATTVASKTPILSGAVQLDQREHVANVANIVAQHRPSS